MFCVATESKMKKIKGYIVSQWKKMTTYKKITTVLAIILMILIWFLPDYFWYRNFKSFYKTPIADVVVDKEWAGNRYQFQISKKEDFFSIYCDDKEYIEKGDSISKKAASDEVRIYRKSSDTQKWNYQKSIYISKDLDLYWLVVGK